MRVRNLNDLIMGMALLLLSAFLFYDTFLFREVYSFSFGPRVFPRIMLGITGFCSLVLILQSLALGGETKQKSALENAKRRPQIRKADMPVLIMRGGMIALLAIYIATLPLVGYLPGTIAFLFLTMLLLGLRTPKLIALYAVISVSVAFTLEYIFGTLLRFFLP